MIPNSKLRLVGSSGVEATGTFGISLNDSAHLMTILRDTLYSDKVLAVLREYSANAWDSHREVGKRDVPIQVTLPTEMDPTLSIRDFGTGLSQEDIFYVYTQYGASTKRGNNYSVGNLGIGSKSAFAYSDSFTITSWYGGEKKTYVAVLDASEKGLVNLLHTEPCDEAETGVLIQIAVRTEDIREFTNKATTLFQHFVPRPIINAELPAPPPILMKLTHGIINEDTHDSRYGEGHWTAVMGCIPYRIDLSQLEGRIAKYLNNVNGTMYFEIGEVQIAASREDLKYSTITKDALVKKFENVVEEYVRVTLDGIQNEVCTPWEKKLRAQILRRLDLPVPKDIEPLVAGSVSLGELPETLAFKQDQTNVKNIAIEANSRILIRDDARALRGYNLTSRDYLVYPGPDTTIDAAIVEVTVLLKKIGLDGLPILRLSELPWAVPTRTKQGKLINPKHKVKTFVLRDNDSFSHPYSEHWEIEKRVATDDDVFVLLCGFKATYEFYLFYKEDRRLAQVCGVPMPRIYGYKESDIHRIDPSTLKGKEYVEWRKGFAKSLLTPTLQGQIEHWRWGTLLGDSYSWRYQNINVKLLKKMVGDFGSRHVITKILARYLKARLFMKKHPKLSGVLDSLSRRLNDDLVENPAQAALNRIYVRYPLFAVEGGIGELWGHNAKVWTQYVKSLDLLASLTALPAPEEVATTTDTEENTP